MPSACEMRRQTRKGGGQSTRGERTLKQIILAVMPTPVNDPYPVQRRSSQSSYAADAQYRAAMCRWQMPWSGVQPADMARLAECRLRAWALRARI
eukprot:scaffold152984_cov35-Tisochrysis_lutea.AAC.4